MNGYSLLYLNNTTNAINTYSAGAMLASGRAPKLQSHSQHFSEFSSSHYGQIKMGFFYMLIS